MISADTFIQVAPYFFYAWFFSMLLLWYYHSVTLPWVLRRRLEKRAEKLHDQAESLACRFDQRSMEYVCCSITLFYCSEVVKDWLAITSAHAERDGFKGQANVYHCIRKVDGLLRQGPPPPQNDVLLMIRELLKLRLDLVYYNAPPVAWLSWLLASWPQRKHVEQTWNAVLESCSQLFRVENERLAMPVAFSP